MVDLASQEQRLVLVAALTYRRPEMLALPQGPHPRLPRRQ
jgi:hypothetical protein